MHSDSNPTFHCTNTVQSEANGPEPQAGSGWPPHEVWRARIENMRAQYARDDENALLNATLKL